MKLTAKIIPIDRRRRLALEKAHEHEVKAATAAFPDADDGLDPQPLIWPESYRSLRSATSLDPAARDIDGETP